jgi:hypothetical protein
VVLRRHQERHAQHHTAADIDFRIVACGSAILDVVTNVVVGVDVLMNIIQ